MTEIRFIDLFAGIGGFRLGLERATSSKIFQSEQEEQARKDRHILSSGRNSWESQGTNWKPKEFHCVWTCEIDKHCRRTYRKQFGECDIAHDITAVDVSRIPDFNLLCAGFPCQSFSIAGKRRGFNDTRGTLFFEICRVLQIKRPWLLLLENVRGLLSHDKGKTFQTILEHLDELGYDCQWEVLNSKNFGVPQNRERVFIIGHLRGEPRFQVFPIRQTMQENNDSNQRQTTGAVKPGWGQLQNDATYLLHNIYGGYNEKEPRVFENISPTIRTPKGGGHLPVVFSTAYTKSNKTKSRIQETETYPCLDSSQAYGVAWRTRTYMNQEGHLEFRDDNIANQLTTVEKDSMAVTSTGIRRLTPLECERLQSFPDNWTLGVADTQRYKMMGNAVTVNVIQAIGERILDRM